MAKVSSSGRGEMSFIPMTSIFKKQDPQAQKCSQWVATEKVHGSSFQMYTDDGVNVHIAGRRRNLDNDESYVRCDMKELLMKYKECVLKTWDIIHSEDSWEHYREPSTEFEDQEDDISYSDDAQDYDEVEDTNSNSEDNGVTRYLEKETHDNDNWSEICRVRIYGELYGGGGIGLPEKSAAQKEIIYCDEFRFYVFGLTINKKWVTVLEMNDLCMQGGFHYYAKPVCKPMGTVDELKQFLTDSGFMGSRSSLTEKKDDHKTNIEGVVMTPLKRPDFTLHAVKLLAPAFLDVRVDTFGDTKTTNFCTKQRYNSVISKLDIPERKDTKLVVNMFIGDIIEECELKIVENRLKQRWAKIVIEWLREDEYDPDKSVLEELARSRSEDSKTVKIPRKSRRNKEEEENKRAERKNRKEKLKAMENDDKDMPIGLFDL